MRLLCVLALPLFLAACGGSSSSPTVGKTSSEVSQQKIAPIGAIAPPGSADRPLKPGASGTEYTPDGLPALQPARGINADMLFAEKINDGNARFDRLETAVTDMRREFDSVKPAIVRLVAVEEDMQALLKQLESLVQNPPPPVESMPLAEPMPEPAPANNRPVTLAATSPPVSAITPVATPAPAPVVMPNTSGMTNVQGLRIGEHANMTRLVIDLSGPVAHKYDLDNTENLLVIEMTGAAWSGKTTQTLKTSPLVQSWSAQPMENGQGSRLIINLNKAVKVVQDNALTSPHRIVIDLQPGA